MIVEHLNFKSQSICEDFSVAGKILQYLLLNIQIKDDISDNLTPANFAGVVN